MAAPSKQLSDGNSGGTGLGQSASDLISFYGATPVAQRSGAVQASLSSSATLTVACQTIAEIQATLTGTGLWKGGA